MKNFSKTITVFTILLIITVILIFTVGLKLLLNSSVFVADFFNKKSPPPLNKSVDVYGSFDIDDIPIATNSARFIISGSVVNYDKIQFYINNEKVKEIDSFSSDTFVEEIGDLEEGDNKVYLKALTGDGKATKKTNVYTVIFKSSKPKLEISEPGDKTVTPNQEITVKGITDKEVFVKINDLPVVVDVNGNFLTLVRLKEGENQIQITAADMAGNTESKTISLNYQKE